MTRIRAPTTRCGPKDSKEPRPVAQGFPLPEPWSCRGTLPRTLVFGSVGDHTDAVESWFGPNGHRRGYEVAIVYYGKDPSGPWADRLRWSADHFAVHAGGKFQNLLWWIERNPHVLSGLDYVVVADDDISMTPETIGRMVRTARAYDLPVASASHAWGGRISAWPHMMARGNGKRASEPAGGVQLCNFVEMTCPLFEADALQRFLGSFRRYAERLTGFGADWLIASACFTDARPFGVMHNVTIVNSRQRPRLARGTREIDTLQPTSARAKAWSEIVAMDAPALSGRQHLRTWLPRPRMRCINLDRASEGRKPYSEARIGAPCFPVRSFPAIDRRDIESGWLSFPHDDAAAIRRIGRTLTAGEIASAATHALLLFEELEFCGPEGVFLLEDGCSPNHAADANRIIDRVLAAVKALPGIEAVAYQEPRGAHTIGQGRAVRRRRSAPLVDRSRPGIAPKACGGRWAFYRAWNVLPIGCGAICQHWANSLFSIRGSTATRPPNLRRSAMTVQRRQDA